MEKNYKKKKAKINITKKIFKNERALFLCGLEHNINNNSQYSVGIGILETSALLMSFS
jgi:hypothetical protein